MEDKAREAVPGELHWVKSQNAWWGNAQNLVLFKFVLSLGPFLRALTGD